MPSLLHNIGFIIFASLLLGTFLWYLGRSWVGFILSIMAIGLPFVLMYSIGTALIEGSDATRPGSSRSTADFDPVTKHILERSEFIQNLTDAFKEIPDRKERHSAIFYSTAFVGLLASLPFMVISNSILATIQEKKREKKLKNSPDPKSAEETDAPISARQE